MILTSETYASKEGALNGNEVVRENGPLDSRYRKEISENAQYYFNLVAANYKIIGTSEMYNSAQARDNGIEPVRNGPVAEVEDNT